MSETVMYKGDLKLVSFDGESVEETCERLLKGHGLTKIPEFYADYREYCLYGATETDCKYVVLDDKVYKIIPDESVDAYDDIFLMNKTGEDSYSYLVKYYNGGCGFDEALNHAFDRVEED